MRLEELVKILRSGQNLSKLDISAVRALTWEKFIPNYVAVLIGFLLASITGFVVALLLLWSMESVSKQKNSNVASIYGLDTSLSFPNKPKIDDYKAIFQRNIFNMTGGIEENSPNKKNAAEAKKSDLPLRFTGIIYGGRADRSLIVLEAINTKTADTFVLGDLVPGDAIIVDIQRDKVFFERNGGREYLELVLPELPPKKRTPGKRGAVGSSGAGVASSEGGSSYREDGFERDGNSVVAARDWVEKAVTMDFQKTLQDAKANPNIVGNEVHGFTLTRIKPDSIYEKMGFKDGDIVKSINGIELNDAARAIRTLQAMRNETALELEVEVNGKTVTKSIKVK